MNEDFIDNDRILGESQPIKRVLQLAEQISQSDSTVLIYGESGTGKELFARFIHDKSFRKNGPFIAVNCAALPDELIENELFGHKQGAYTDATEDSPGKFGVADGGTIFLDEIGELNYHLQAKLLRVLQQKEYEPIGSSCVLKSDVRVIAATNCDILKLIQDNLFREDLYYRLNVVPLTIPALRDRGRDIELLANYFLMFYNKKNKKEIISFDDTVLDIFYAYHWPGNVRELQNVVERAVVLCVGSIIDRELIVLYNGFLKGNNKNNFKSLKDAVDDFKRDYIVSILENNNWNQTCSAKVLDIQRSYLSRLIKELHISKI